MVMRFSSGCASCRLRAAFSSRSRAVHVETACATRRDRKASENLCLQGISKSLRALDAVLARGLFQIGERGDTERVIKLEHLVGPQARHGEHFQDTGRDFRAHSLQAWMRVGAMQFRDDIGNSVADARDFREPSCVYDLL